MAKIALIVGSVRQERQGIKVARWMEEKLKSRNHVVFFIDPPELNLPLLDKMYKEMAEPSEKMKSLQSKINDAEGYLAVTPEYNHSTTVFTIFRITFTVSTWIFGILFYYLQDKELLTSYIKSNF